MSALQRKVPLPLLLGLYCAAVGAHAADRVDLSPILVQGALPDVTEKNGQRLRVDVDEIATRQPEHLSEVLRGVPGVDIGGTSSMNQRIFIRGVPDTKLAITLDGARQGGHHFHHSGDLSIDPMLLKSVDVSVGNNSVRNPSGSFGGAVRFATVDASDLLAEGERFGGKLRLGYATNDARKSASLALFGRTAGRFEWLGGVNVSGHGYGEDGDGRRIGSDADVHSGLLKGQWQVAPAQVIDATVQYYRDEGLYPNRTDFPPTGLDDWNPPSQQELERQTYALGYRWQPSDRPWDIQARLYRNRVEQSREHGAGATVGTTTGLTLDVTQQLTGTTLGHEFAYGLDLYHLDNRLDIKRPLLGGRLQPVRGDEQLTSTALYLQDTITFGALSLTPGLRFEQYDASELQYSDETYRELTKALGLRWQATDSLGLFANYTELFRGPPAQEMLISHSTPVIVNNHLDAETGENYEVGLSFNPQGFFHADDRLMVQVKVFRTEYDKLIETRYVQVDSHDRDAPHPKELKELVNIDDVTVDGLEASVDYVLEPVTVRLTYSRAESEDRNGQPLERDTGDRYAVSLRYRPQGRGLVVGWDSRLVMNHQIVSHDGPFEQPGYTVSDLFVRRDFGSGRLRGLSAELGIYNLFDKHYASQTSRNLASDGADYEPGHDIRLNLTYRF